MKNDVASTVYCIFTTLLPPRVSSEIFFIYLSCNKNPNLIVGSLLKGHFRAWPPHNPYPEVISSFRSTHMCVCVGKRDKSEKASVCVCVCAITTFISYCSLPFFPSKFKVSGAEPLEGSRIMLIRAQTHAGREERLLVCVRERV